MPALQFEQLPAAQVKEIRGGLHASWQIEADALNRSWFPDRGKFDTAVAKLNAKFQQMELTALTQLQQQTEEQQRVQQLIKGGTQGMGRGEEAAVRMELGPEAERLAFLPQQQQQPYSIGQITSESVMESISEFAEAAPTTAKFWTRAANEPKTERGLQEQYLEWRSLIQYDAINPLRQQQLDQQWDAYMAGDKRFDEWWSDKGKRKPTVEIKALRTPGKMGKLMQDRIVGAGGASPLGRSVAKGKPRFTLPTEPLTFGMEAAHRLLAPSKPRQEQAPIRQRNKRTRQERISYDGGRTWQMIG